VQNPPSPPAISYDDDFDSRPTAESPAFEDTASEAVTVQTKYQKPGYMLILIIALISLLLIGATGFFVYSIYMKSKPPPVQQQSE
jgi:preprotein translocase subunit Sss1